MQQDGIALTNRGEDFNAAFAELYPFATNVDSVLAVLRRDSAATTTLLHDGGQVFSALSHSPAQLQGFIRNSNAVFAATAAQDTALAEHDPRVPGVHGGDARDDRPGQRSSPRRQAADRRVAAGRRASSARRSSSP